jgi:phosphomannomutase/phosphoglucomutase
MLHALSDCVKKNQADIGFAFDGDGDRIGVVDENGNEIFSDKIGLLIARSLSTEYKNSKFIVDVKSTGLFKTDEVLKKNSCKTIYWKTGHSYIKRKVSEEKSLAGFEKSGHFFFNKPLGLGYDDGILSAIQVCKLLDKNSPKKISDLFNELPTTYQSPTMAPYCSDEEKYKVVGTMIKKFKELFERKTKITDKFISEILTVNGIRFILEDGSWGLIRASSNKPTLVIVTESVQSIVEMKAIFNFIDDLLKATRKVGEYDQKI